MEIGERIRSIRESKGMTQKELAESLNISNSLMNHFEQGLQIPSLSYIPELSRALNVPPQDILCDILIKDHSTAGSVSEEIKLTVEKFPADWQLRILNVLKLVSDNIDKL
ncbi:MAG: helix-turn-helix transcriptional regulator [Dorea sp.]|nr:helix-turn-helix transcriptional regulator [Dorea sp.]